MFDVLTDVALDAVLANQPSAADVWVIELVPAAGSTVPMAVRMRSFLKAALRQYRLRCTAVRGVVTPPKPECSDE